MIRFQFSRLLACATLGIIALPAAGLSQDDPVTKVRIAAARAKSANNLKQIALGFHIYADDSKGIIPRDITDANGKPLLSWRVLLLKYVDQEKLFKEFKLDEAWDSTHNKQLLARMPKLYEAPYGKFEPGHTVYQSFSGEGALMSGKPIKIFTIQDGTSNTFMVAEAGEAVPWTKPADIAFDANKPLPKMGAMFDGAFNVAFCDGSVRFVSKGVKDAVLKKFITLNGAEIVGADDLNPGK